MSEFDDFMGGGVKAPFKRNQWGNWDLKDANGRDPFDDYNRSLSAGSTYSLNEDGSVGVQKHDTAGGVWDGWRNNLAQRMFSSMLDATGGYKPQLNNDGSFSAAGGGAGGPMGGMLGGALRRDTNAMQGAADRQWGRNNQQIWGMADFLGHGPSDIMGVAGQTAGVMGQQANAIDRHSERVGEGVNRETDRMVQDARGGVGGVNKDVDEAYRLGNEAVAKYDQSIKEREDMSNEQASVTAAAIAQRGRALQQQMGGKTNPDGTPKTSAQVAQEQYEVSQQVGQETQTAITQIHSQFQNTMAEMQQGLAQLRMGNAGMRLQGGALRLDATKTLAGVQQQSVEDKLAGEHSRQQWSQISQRYREMDTQIRNAGVLAATQLEFQGRTALADMIRQNPESVVSWFQGLLAMYSAQSAATGVARAA